MIFDYISDLHEDRDLFNIEITENSIIDFFGKLKPVGEVLLVAGDTSDTNSRLIKTLDIIQKLYYKKVVFVLGNHELFTFANFPGYKEKIESLKEELNNYENLILLDGDIYKYKGVRIGGAMMWYDGTYSKFINKDKINFFEEYGIKKYDLNKVWELSMPDYGNIANYNHFKELFFIEKNKLKKIHKKSDILLTHISPLCNPKYVNKIFKNDLLSSFFYFDGFKFIDETTAKHWVFGHIHSELEVFVGKVSFHCNPYGVMKKNFYRKVFLKQIEI